VKCATGGWCYLLQTRGSFNVRRNEWFRLYHKCRRDRVMRITVKVDRCELWADATVCWEVVEWLDVCQDLKQDSVTVLRHGGCLRVEYWGKYFWLGWRKHLETVSYTFVLIAMYYRYNKSREFVMAGCVACVRASKGCVNFMKENLGKDRSLYTGVRVK